MLYVNSEAKPVWTVQRVLCLVAELQEKNYGVETKSNSEVGAGTNVQM